MKFATNYKSTFKYGTLQLRLVLTVENKLNRKNWWIFKKAVPEKRFWYCFYCIYSNSQILRECFLLENS